MKSLISPVQVGNMASFGQFGAPKPGGIGVVGKSHGNGVLTVPGSKKGGFREAIIALKRVLFDERLSIQRFADDWQSNKGIMSFIQSLLIVVLRTSPSIEGAYSILWERIYFYLENGIVDRLFDCLEALSPCSNACGCGGHTRGSNMTAVGVGERIHTLDTGSILMIDDANLNPRVVHCEVMELQTVIMQTLAGVLRVIPKVISHNSNLRVPGIHSELGILPRAAGRLLSTDTHSGLERCDAPATPLVHRMMALCTCMRRGGLAADEDALVESLGAKVGDAAKLLILSSIDSNEVWGGKACSPQAQWCGGHMPPAVVLSLLASRFFLEPSEDLSVRQGGDCTLLACLEEMASGERESGAVLGGKAQKLCDELLGEECTAEMLFRTLEGIVDVAEGSWLLSRTSSEQTMPWKGEWEETIHGQARETLFETLGVICLALQHMERVCPSKYQRYEGALLRVLDEAVRAVLAGWDDHLLLLQNSCETLIGTPQNPPKESFQAGLFWLLHTSRTRREYPGQVGSGGRMHAVFLMSEALMCAEETEHTSGAAGYGALLMMAATDLCRWLPQLDADVRSSGAVCGHNCAPPQAEVLESLLTVKFCFGYMEIGADVEALENSLGGSLSSSLCVLAVLAVKQFIGVQHAETRAAWQTFAATALDCMGHYAWHAGLCGAHQLAVNLVSQAISHFDSAAVSSQITPVPAPFAPAGTGMCRLFAHVLAQEDMDPMCRMPITKSLLAFTQNLFNTFQKHFSAPLGRQQQENGQGAPTIDPHTTNAAIALAKIEDACSDPSKLQRNEWKTVGTNSSGHPAWGWYTAYPTSFYSSSVSFHLLVPLVQFAIENVLPLSSRLRAMWNSNDNFSENMRSFEMYSHISLNAERSRDIINAVNTVIRMIDSFLSDEVLLLSLLRTETFFQRSAPNALQSAHVGCAGLQDRPDLFVYVFHWLERESGPVTHLLKLMEARRARPGSSHRGLDSAMCGALSLLRRVLLFRCDKHVAPNDTSLERAALQLAPVVVACMCLPERSLAVPSLVLSDDIESLLSKEASRLLSIVCRIDLQPTTIRQSWTQWSRDLAQEQRRTLLEIATCNEAPVDARAAVLVFLSEVLLSQPGLADWLFEEENDNSTGMDSPTPYLPPILSVRVFVCVRASACAYSVLTFVLACGLACIRVRLYEVCFAFL